MAWNTELFFISIQLVNYLNGKFCSLLNWLIVTRKCMKIFLFLYSLATVTSSAKHRKRFILFKKFHKFYLINFVFYFLLYKCTADLYVRMICLITMNEFPQLPDFLVSLSLFDFWRSPYLLRFLLRACMYCFITTTIFNIFLY